MTPLLYLAVIAAGSLGALARAGVGVLLTRRGANPTLATLTVNLLGAAALGCWLGAAAGSAPGWSLVVGTGFLGAFTTFSTWTVELVARWRAGARAAVFGSAVATLATGVGLVWVGLVVGARLAAGGT